MKTHKQFWSVAEAFLKFGFGDGDGLVHTDEVGEALEDAGFSLKTVTGLHNNWICKVSNDSWVREFDGYQLPPWKYLPGAFIEALKKVDPTLTEEEWLSQEY